MYIMHMIYNASIHMCICMHMHIYVCAYYMHGGIKHMYI